MLSQDVQLDFKRINQELQEFDKILPALEAELRQKADNGWQLGMATGLAISTVRGHVRSCLSEYTSPSQKQYVAELLSKNYDRLVDFFKEINPLLSSEVRKEVEDFLRRLGDCLGRHESFNPTQEHRKPAEKFLETGERNDKAGQKQGSVVDPAISYPKLISWIDETMSRQGLRNFTYKYYPGTGPSEEELKGFTLPHTRAQLSGMKFRDYVRMCAILKQTNYNKGSFIDELIKTAEIYDQRLSKEFRDLKQAYNAFTAAENSHYDACQDLFEKISNNRAPFLELQNQALLLVQRVRQDAALLGVGVREFDGMIRDIQNAKNTTELAKGVGELRSFCWKMSFSWASTRLEIAVERVLERVAPINKIREEIRNLVSVDENNQLQVDPSLFDLKYIRIFSKGPRDYRHVVQLGQDMRQAVENYNLVARRGRIENLEVAFMTRLAFHDSPDLSASAKSHTYQQTQELVSETVKMLSAIRNLSQIFQAVPDGDFFSIGMLSRKYSAMLLETYRSFLLDYGQNRVAESQEKYRKLMQLVRESCDIVRGFFAHATQNRPDVLLNLSGEEGMFLANLLNRHGAK